MSEELNQGTQTETVTQDNSQESLEAEIAKVLDEPEENTSETTQEGQEDPSNDEPKDNTIQCPEKFKNKDGSVNVENLVKSYTELESSSSQQKASWEKEKAELQKAKEQLDAYHKQQEEQARQAGFNSQQDMQNMYELISTEANEYYKYIGQTDDPERVTGMLQDYINNPTEEKREDIELEFSPEVIRNVAIATERRRFQLEQTSQTNAQTQETMKIENTIQQLCEKHNNILQDENVKNFVVSQFAKFGSALDFETASAMLTLLEQREGGFKQKVDELAAKENKKATDKIAAISNSSSAPASDEDWSNFDNLSPSQQEKIIGKYL
jgi:hypothetical protein